MKCFSLPFGVGVCGVRKPFSNRSMGTLFERVCARQKENEREIHTHIHLCSVVRSMKSIYRRTHTHLKQISVSRTRVSFFHVSLTLHACEVEEFAHYALRFNANCIYMEISWRWVAPRARLISDWLLLRGVRGHGDSLILLTRRFVSMGKQMKKKKYIKLKKIASAKHCS